MNEFVAVTSTNVAKKILNKLPAQKRAGWEEADADIVVWDRRLRNNFALATTTPVLDYNVFEEGLRCARRALYPRIVEVIWAWGQIHLNPGRGRFIPLTCVPLGECGVEQMERAERTQDDQA
jgi:hypothetical protein